MKIVKIHNIGGKTNRSPLSMSQALIKTFGAESSNFKLGVDAVGASETKAAVDKKVDELVCPQHPDKQIEAYCRKDDALLCVVCILDQGHQHHDVVTLSRAYKEQKLYVKHKLSKVVRNKDKLKDKREALVKTLDEIEHMKDKAISESEEFYDNIIDIVARIKKDNITSINRTFQSYKRDLVLEQSKITQILDTLRTLGSKALKSNVEKAAIKFLKCRKDIDTVVQNYSEV